jgi:hypothetical protein
MEKSQHILLEPRESTASSQFRYRDRRADLWDRVGGI